MIDAHELARHLQLPDDHRIVRIEDRGAPHPPGLVVVVEGAAGFVCPKGGAVYYHHFYQRWRDDESAFMRTESIKQFGAYEW